METASGRIWADRTRSGVAGWVGSRESLGPKFPGGWGNPVNSGTWVTLETQPRGSGYGGSVGPLCEHRPEDPTGARIQEGGGWSKVLLFLGCLLQAKGLARGTRQKSSEFCSYLSSCCFHPFLLGCPAFWDLDFWATSPGIWGNPSSAWNNNQQRFIWPAVFQKHKSSNRDVSSLCKSLGSSLFPLSSALLSKNNHRKTKIKTKM